MAISRAEVRRTVLDLVDRSPAPVRATVLGARARVNDRRAGRRRTRRAPLALQGQMLRPGWVTESLQPRLSGAPDVARPRILYLHVPKTGGTSMAAMLGAHVPAEQIFTASGNYEWTSRSVEELRGYRLFVGHNFLEPLYQFPTDEWVSVLTVRDPVDWWTSYYKYNRRRLPTMGRGDDPMMSMTLDQWLAGRSDEMLSNPQSSWLLSRARLMFDSLVPPATGLVGTGERLQHDPGAAAALLQRLVAGVDVAGVTDELFDVYCRVCALLGWQPQREQALRRNTSPADDDLVAISPAQARRLRRLTAMDSWLVDLVRAHASRRPAPARPPVPAS
ncbi:MAG: hypothetical protein EPO13_07790 [Actinomycetota bacterium]|nr:MAG: hypothetical protein EPO13_07790 [Actinomycetota bacterium]